MRESFASRNIPAPALSPYRQLPRISIQRDAPLPLWSCGTFANDTTLHFLLGGRLPHSLPANYITRNYTMALHIALLEWLITPPLPRPLDDWLSPRRHPTPSRGAHRTIPVHDHCRGKLPAERPALAPHGPAPQQHSQTKGPPHISPGGPARTIIDPKRMYPSRREKPLQPQRPAGTKLPAV